MEHIITIAVIVILALLIAAVVFVFIKRRKGCCKSDDSAEKRIKVSDKNMAHYPHCARLTISGMTCSKCKLRVENALNAKGSIWAKVDLKEGNAIVCMKELLPDDTLRRIVSREGFTVVGIERIR